MGYIRNYYNGLYIGTTLRIHSVIPGQQLLPPRRRSFRTSRFRPPIHVDSARYLNGQQAGHELCI